MPRIRVDLLIFNRQGLNFKADFAKLEYRWWFGGADTVLGLGAGLPTTSLASGRAQVHAK